MSNAGNVCFRCKKGGHWARNCPTLQGEKCFRCQLPGHFARDCPNAKQRNREQHAPSYALIPVIVDDDAHSFTLVLQQSISAAKHDEKIDPFRGHQDAGETPLQTALREAHEESNFVFDLKTLGHNQQDALHFFAEPGATEHFVRVTMPGEAPTNLSKLQDYLQRFFTSNSTVIAAHPGNFSGMGETMGIRLITLEAGKKGNQLHGTPVRLAGQTVQILRGFKFDDILALPPVPLVTAKVVFHGHEFTSLVPKFD